MTTLEANMVIIGGGGAGMAAAFTVMQKGVTGIIMLEKRLTIGGNSAMAGGMLFAVESHFQKADEVKTTCDDVFKETMQFHHYDRVNPRIIRTFLDNSAGTIQWLEDNGVEYDYRGGHVMKNTTTPFGGFGRAMKILAAKFTAGGGQILSNIGAKKIQRAADGKITGVVAVNKDGEGFNINTRSIMLATGGFTDNRELLHSYFPYYYDDNYATDAIPNAGDGIRLAAEAGACLEEYCTLIRENGYCFDKSGKVPNRVHMSQGAVWVNKYGRRYADETNGHDNASTNALLAQPGKTGFVLLDDALVETIMNTPGRFWISRKIRYPDSLPGE